MVGQNSYLTIITILLWIGAVNSINFGGFMVRGR